MSDIPLKKAVEAVKAGTLSAGQAAREFRVPETTLRSHLTKLGIVAAVVSIVFFSVVVTLIPLSDGFLINL